MLVPPPSPRTRWLRRLVVIGGTVGAFFAFRQRKFEQNARIYGLG